jgi:hypothetical protein
MAEGPLAQIRNIRLMWIRTGIRYLGNLITLEAVPSQQVSIVPQIFQRRKNLTTSGCCEQEQTFKSQRAIRADVQENLHR